MVIISIFILGFFSFVESSSADVNTVFIDDDYNDTTQGWNVDRFSTISDAINATEAGDTVIVYNGTYFEHIYVEKSIVIIGEKKKNKKEKRLNNLLLYIIKVLKFRMQQ